MKQKCDRYEMHKYWGKKPAGQLRTLIDTYTQPGDTVMDTFSGYGVFCFEAYAMGRNVISNDLNPMAHYIQKQLFRDDVNFKKLHKEFEAVVVNMGDFIDAWFSAIIDGQKQTAVSVLRNTQDEIIAVVDRGGMTGFGQERECNEENNEMTVTLSESGATPDLSIELISIDIGYCPDLTLNFDVRNSGQGEVTGFEVGLYLGDASQGGTRIDTLIIDEPLAPGATTNLTWESQRFPSYRTAGISLTIDPRNVIVECDDNNNTSAPSEPLTCEVRDGQ